MEQTMAQERRFRPGGFVGWAMNAWRTHASSGARRRERGLQVRETLALGGRRQIALVTCGERQFLVGMGSDTVDAIVPIEEPREQRLPARAHWEGGF